MPQVPYSGAPSVDLQNNATPTMGVNTPEAAFGGATAAATQNLGRAVSGAGDELFARGLAMQDLFNHSQALEADTKYMEAAGNIHAKLSAMQGKDAVDYFTNGYHQDLQDARKQIRDSLPNDMARKIYDQSSMSTYGRTVFNGAGHAASANKSYAIGAAAAKVQQERNAALATPEDDNAFEAHLQNTADNVTAQYRLKGADDVTIKDAVQQAQSNLWHDRIAGMARQDPFGANKLLMKASKDGSINGEDMGRVTQIVQTAMRGVGARNISNTVHSGVDLSWGEKPVPISSAKFAIGSFESNNNYGSIGVETAHGRALGRYQIMEENLPSWLKDSGLPPMSAADFLKSPSAQDKVFETKFGQMMQQTGTFNDAASMWFSGRPRAQAGGAKDALGTSVPQYLAGTNKYLAQNAPLADQVAAGRTLAAQQAPNDPLLPDFAEERIRTDAAHMESARRFDEAKQVSTIQDAILQGNNGKPFATVDEMRHFNPDADAAYSQLSPPKQIQVQRNLNSYNSAVTKITHQNTAHQLQGLAYGSPEDVDKFLNTNIFEQDLSQGDMNKFTKLQRQLQKDRGGNVEIRQALHIAEPLLNAAGVDLKNKELMARFRGSYIDSIYDWKQANPNKPLPEDQAKKLAAQAIQQGTSENFWWGKDYMFNLPLPNKLVDDIRAKNPNVSDAELEIWRQEYVRQQLRALQQSKAKGPT